MKLAALLAASAAAHHDNDMDHLMEQWWTEAVNVFNFASGNWAQFAGAVDSVPDSNWQPLWGFCNPNGDGEVTTAELSECGAKAAAWAGMSEDSQNFIYQFVSKYWGVLDQDGSGSLDYDEFRYILNNRYIV